MLKKFQESGTGAGILSVKNMDGNKVIGYDAMCLTSGERRPFIIRHAESEITADCRHILGPYGFLEETYQWIEHKMEQWIIEKRQPIYLDEIGKLELEGEGFDRLMSRLVESDIELCITVRDKFLEAVLNRYEIKNYVKITCQ